MSLPRGYVQSACLDDSREIISRDGAYPEVIRVGHYAIKFGRVHAGEAYNQQMAFSLLDPAIIRIPQVYDYFCINDCGFLVMEFVDGRHPKPAEFRDVVPKVAKCLEYMHRFARPLPGPFLPGVSRGIIWTDEQELVFPSKAFLAGYLNSRLLNGTGAFNLNDTQMVLCHLDFAPRNILLEGSQLWLLDWESAGYYPRAFEYCSIRMNCGGNGEDRTYAFMLENALVTTDPLEPHEIGQDVLMETVAGNNIHYDLYVHVISLRHNNTLTIQLNQKAKFKTRTSVQNRSLCSRARTAISSLPLYSDSEEFSSSACLCRASLIPSVLDCR